MMRMLAVLILLLAPGAVSAQGTIAAWNPRTAEMTREQLLEIQQRLEDAAASPGYSAALKEQARREANLIQERLDQGDFQVGDRIVLRVQGVSQFTDTATVQAGRVITLRDIGEIPLDGVLRSELQEHMEEELGRYLQDPRVRARSLIRIAVLGAVSRQGFYAIPADALIEDALMIAGGPAAAADIDDTEIRRGDQVLLGGDGVQQAIIDGRTLDQLGLRAGDRIVVPVKTGGLFSGGVVRGLLTIVPTVVLLLTRFSRR